MPDEQKFSMAEIEALAKALGLKHDTSSTPGSIQQPHGYIQNSTTGGLFSRPGAEPDVYSAIRRPFPSLLSRLLMGVNTILNPEYDILTGIDDGSGTNASNFCGTAPKPGLARLCTTRSQFGKWFVQTEPITLNEIGGRINRGDVDRNVINNPQLFPFVPEAFFAAQNPNTTLGLALLRLGIWTERQMAKVLYSGVSGSNSTTGFISEFDGFDRLIKTGHVDIETGLSCNAADSLIVDRASVQIGSGTNIVTQIGGMMYKLERRAEQSGMLPTEWTFSMHPDLFEALTRVWPLSYYTENNTGSSDATPMVSQSLDMVRIRDDMRENRYLPIRGKRYPVHLDDAIPTADSGNGMKSDIYIIPLAVLGGTRVTYVEGFDQANPQVNEFLSLVPNGVYRTSNGGMYAMTQRQTGFCFEWLFAAQPRLVMRTPWLAARLTNVGYTLDLYQDDPINTSGAYYVNGGRYSSKAPYTYA